MSFSVSLDKNFPGPPQSKELLSFYEILGKLRDMLHDDISKPESQNLQMPLELTAQEVHQLKQLLRALECDPSFDNETQSKNRAMLKKLEEDAP